MPGIDENLLFRSLGIAVLTISDTRTSENDRSGDALARCVTDAGHYLVSRAIVPDDTVEIAGMITRWENHSAIDAILTTGGTGLTGRDVTVEAISPMLDKTLDGFSVLFHRMSFDSVGLATLQSRACAGLIDTTFVFCLPGSTGAVTEAWDHIIRDALDSRYRPCSLVDLIPRLSE